MNLTVDDVSISDSRTVHVQAQPSNQTLLAQLLYFNFRIRSIDLKYGISRFAAKMWNSAETR